MMVKVEEVKEKVAWGTYSKIFWKFYRLDKQASRSEYPDVESAMKAQKAMLNRMNVKHIYDVRITRQGNVLYLEKTEVGKC